jgi:catechol 2,3-dioxygenase-like lactoylglutathione lyase family enzyme
MTVLGIHHVNITVGDLGQALEFYLGRLGLAQRADRPDFSFGGAWIDVGAQQIHLVVDPARTIGSAMAVADVDALVADLRSHGHQVSEPKPTGAGSRQCFLRDPWGNLLELQQPD